jgi:phosphoglucosamine mutase
MEEKADAGAVISASHNPVEDNGIKFFSAEGMKIAAGVEEEIERLMKDPPGDLPLGVDVGVCDRLDDATDRYVDHVVATLGTPLSGLRVVLDCAFGAAWDVAPRAFEQAGAEVVTINAEADGARINVACGSTDMTQMSKVVTAEGADLGIAFDGDADRALAVDENGTHVDGDRIIAALARRLHQHDRLTHSLVVATVMSNLGFVRALEGHGIEVIAAPVGDKHVAEEMAKRGAVLGGEQSGHVIFGDHSTTGDGILTGLHLAQAVAASDEPLSALVHWWEPWSQVLINVPATAKDRLDQAEAVWAEVARVEASLGDDGRVLLRPSGTEPLVRVMVEAADASAAEAGANRLAEAVRTHLA